MTEYEKPMTIPEMLGFSPIPFDRKRALSLGSYRAQFLLYEDEARDLLEEFAPDKESREAAHPYIVAALNQRFIDDAEYRERIKGGYPAMQRKMEAAGLIPPEEQEALDRLNAKSEDHTERVAYIGAVGEFETAGSVMANIGMLQVEEPKPHPKHRQRSTLEAFSDLADELSNTNELQEWLDACMARGDHELGENRFRWDDIPKDAQPALRKMLAMRYIEAMLDEGNPLIIKHLEDRKLNA